MTFDDITDLARTCSHATVTIPTGETELEGELALPQGTPAVVVFVHGSGSSRHSPRNQRVASMMRDGGLGTLLVDLLTGREEQEDFATGALRFDMDLLTDRLIGITRWLKQEPQTQRLQVGYFGASTGAGAALMAAAEWGYGVAAVVSRGGRPDLADGALPLVRAPTLLLVGSLDDIVIGLNERAYEHLRCEKTLRVVPGASHLFHEPGRLEEVARLSTTWFQRHMREPHA